MPFVVQIDGYDPVAAAAVTLRAASVDDAAVCHLDGQTWWPVIDRLPTLAMDFFGGEFGRVTTPASSMSLSVEPWPLFGRFSLADARLRLWHGDDGAAWAGYTLRFDGRVSANTLSETGIAEIGFAVDDKWLDQPLLATYAGTGGIEGLAAQKGREKPLAIGSPLGAPGVVLDPVKTIIQLSSYGPVEGIDVPLERLSRQFGSPVADYAGYAALAAALVAAGTWVTANAIGCVRMGAPPYGKICFLMRGDKGGPDSWVRRPGAIIKRIAGLAGGEAKVNEASMDALDSARPYDLSLYVDRQTTARTLIQPLAASVNAVAGVTLTGELFAIPVQINASGLILQADGSALPIVASVKELGISAPWWRLSMGAQPFWDVHAQSDVLQDLPADIVAVTTTLADPDILKAVEKQVLVASEAAFDGRYATTYARAAALGITTELTAAYNAHNARLAARAAIAPPLATTTVDSPINRTNWNALLSADSAALDALDKRISEIDATTATVTNGVLNGSGGVVVANNSTTGNQGSVSRPGGGFYSPVGQVTGAIKISLPHGPSSGYTTMLDFDVSVFEYASGGTVTYHLAGYTYAPASYWINVTATMQGGASFSRPVRFGSDNSKWCVWIGDPTTVWEFPSVQILNVKTSYGSFGHTLWEAGWLIGVDTAAATNVSTTVLQPTSGFARSGTNIFDAAGSPVGDAQLLNSQQLLEQVIGKGAFAGFNSLGLSSAYLTGSLPVTKADAGLINTYIGIVSGALYNPGAAGHGTAISNSLLGPGQNLIPNSDQTLRQMFMLRWNPDAMVLPWGTAPVRAADGWQGWTTSNFEIPGNVKSCSIYQLGRIASPTQGFADFDIDRGDGGRWRTACSPGDVMIGSAYFATLRCLGRLYLTFEDAAGNLLSYPQSVMSASTEANANKLSLPEMVRLSVKATAPAGTYSASIIMSKGNTFVGMPDSYIWVAAPQLERAGASQVEPSPYAPGPPADTRQLGFAGALNATANFGALADLSEIGLSSASLTGSLPVAKADAGLINTNIGILSGALYNPGAAGHGTAVANSLISLGANGILGGAGGGAVTIGGLGYLGSLTATEGADIATNVKNGGTIIAKEKLLNDQVIIAPDGTLSYFNGISTINLGAVTFAALPGKSLAATDAAASTKLTGIAAGATVGGTWGTNIGSIPVSLSDGRVAAALAANGDVARNLPANIGSVQAAGVIRTLPRGAQIIELRDGDVYTFPQAWGNGQIPSVRAFMNGYNDTSNYIDNQVIGLTATGFTASCKKVSPGTLTLQTETTSGTASGIRTHEKVKQLAAEAHNDSYEFSVNVSITNLFVGAGEYDPGQIVIGLWTFDGATWQMNATLSQYGGSISASSSATLKGSVSRDLMGANDRFGVSVESSLYGGSISAFTSVKYYTTSGNTISSATPTGYPSIPFLVMGGVQQ